MTSKIHLVMPMGGKGSRFSREGFGFPKPMIQIYGKPFFYWATRSVSKFLELESLDFVILQEHIDKYKIDAEIHAFFPEAGLHILPEVTEGAVITCLKGIENINDDLPVMFNDCDHLFKCARLNEFCRGNGEKSADGMLLTFESDEAKYSFVEKDPMGNVIRTVEKEAVSNEAICGCYYFASSEIFKAAANEYLARCDYTEYFMSGVYNVMIDHGQCVRSLKTDFHVPFGVPEEYELAKGSGAYKELL